MDVLDYVTEKYQLALTEHCPKKEVFHKVFLQEIWPYLQETGDLVTFIEIVLNGNLHFLCSVISFNDQYCFHIETSSLIREANQLPGSYMGETYAIKILKLFCFVLLLKYFTCSWIKERQFPQLKCFETVETHLKVIAKILKRHWFFSFHNDDVISFAL